MPGTQADPIDLGPLMYDRGRGPELRSRRITVYDLHPYKSDPGFFTDEYLCNLWRITSAELDALKRYEADHAAEVSTANKQIDERHRKAREAQQTPEWQAKHGSRGTLEAFKQFYYARQSDPTLFAEIDGEGRVARRERLMQAFARWLQTKAATPAGVA